MSQPIDFEAFARGARQMLGKEPPPPVSKPTSAGTRLRFEFLDIWLTPGWEAYCVIARIEGIYPGTPRYRDDAVLVALPIGVLVPRLRTHIKTGEMVSCRCYPDTCHDYSLDLYVPNKREGRSWMQLTFKKRSALGGGKVFVQRPILRHEMETLLREIEARLPPDAA